MDQIGEKSLLPVGGFGASLAQLKSPFLRRKVSKARDRGSTVANACWRIGIQRLPIKSVPRPHGILDRCDIVRPGLAGSEISLRIGGATGEGEAVHARHDDIGVTGRELRPATLAGSKPSAASATLKQSASSRAHERPQ